MKILIVDDEDEIRSIIKEYCLNDGYEVTEASNGLDAIDLINNNKFDLMVLDIMMPKMDGYTMLKDLKKKIPTIVLSARGEEFDILSGFDLGIDDYLTKPFSPKELMARIKAILNRVNNTQDIYKYKDLELNYLSHTLKIKGKLINLTPKEYELLCYFISNKNIAISRERLLSNIWGYDFFGDDRTIDTHIKMLRNNLGEYRNHIITVRGFGYKYVEDEE